MGPVTVPPILHPFLNGDGSPLDSGDMSDTWTTTELTETMKETSKPTVVTRRGTTVTRPVDRCTPRRPEVESVVPRVVTTVTRITTTGTPRFLRRTDV